MTNKLDIGNEMRQFDRKNRKFYDELTEEERKKFSPFLMIRWGSCVEGSRDLQEFYLIATNERLNKNFFDLSKHPKLQWLLATTVSPDMGTFRHNWISNKKNQTGDAKKRKQLAEMFPTYKDDEIDVMMQIITDKEIKEYLAQLGEEVK
jgi:hypothetical protein